VNVEGTKIRLQVRNFSNSKHCTARARNIGTGFVVLLVFNAKKGT
jgi:hypothetical protein